MLVSRYRTPSTSDRRVSGSTHSNFKLLDFLLRSDPYSVVIGSAADLNFKVKLARPLEAFAVSLAVSATVVVIVKGFRQPQRQVPLKSSWAHPVLPL